jgi:hypothetical protein
VILGHQAATGGEVVCSLDHFVCQLRRWVRATRRARKGRPPIPHERSGWWLEREERRHHQLQIASLGPRRSRRRRAR